MAKAWAFAVTMHGIAMKFGITYTLKDTQLDTSNLPDDWQEELDNMVTIDGIAGVLTKLGYTVVKLGDGPDLQA